MPPASADVQRVGRNEDQVAWLEVVGDRCVQLRQGVIPFAGQKCRVTDVPYGIQKRVAMTRSTPERLGLGVQLKSPGKVHLGDRPGAVRGGRDQNASEPVLG